MAASTEIKNVVVMGAGGNLGRLLVPALVEAGFTVSAVTRPSSTATFPPGVTVHRAEYNDVSALENAFSGQDAVVSTIATFSAAEQKIAIDAAVAAKVKRFLPSEYGGDTSLAGAGEFAPFATAKREIVAYLKDQEDKGMSWTAICTGLFISWLLELGDGVLGWDIDRRKVTIFDSGTQRLDISTLPQVCRAVISTLRKPDAARNTYVYVRSFTTCQNEILEALERCMGEKFEVTHDKAVDMSMRGRKHLEEGDYDNGYPEVVTGAAYGPWGFIDFGEQAARWNRVLDLPEEETLQSVIQSVLEKKGTKTPQS